MKNAKLLVVDDDPSVLGAVSDFLKIQGYSVAQAQDLQSAHQAIENNLPDIVVTDYELPDGDALQLLATLKTMNAPTQCIVLTGHGTIDLAVRAIKDGAEQFLTKPVQLSVLASYIRSCLENQKSQRMQLARRLRTPRYGKNPFQGTSESIRRLEAEIHRFVHTERPILIQGETGTGKGVLAEWIHKHGPRADETLVDVNCAGLSKELLESELFGYERGAFTGATGSKQGLIEAAHRGILFLDEVGEMDLLVQPKLLKVLENSRFRRLGDVRERTADIQVIAATNRNLMQSVREMKFREDLYFRMCTFEVRLVPLRERPEDILPLAESLLQDLATDLARERQELTGEAQELLKTYSWPGNIRELRNVLERVVLTCDSPVIQREDLGLVQRLHSTPQPSLALSGTLEEVERQYICQVLKEERGRVAQAAVRLGVPRSTLYQKIKAFGIVTDHYEKLETAG